MTDRTTFESRLAARLAAHAAVADRPIDTALIAATAAASSGGSGRGWTLPRPGRSGRRASSRLLWLALAVLLLTMALVGGAMLAGGWLGRLTTDGIDRGAITVASLEGRIEVIRPDGRVDRLVVADLDWPPPQLVGDGEHVAMWTRGTQDSILTIAPLDGSPPITFPELRRHSTNGWAFSADGTRLAFLSTGGGSSDLTIVSLIDRTATVVARDLLDARGVAWSPDSRRLAMGHFSEESSGIDLIDADGANLQPLVREPRDPQSPTDGIPIFLWSPDGTRLSYNVTPHRENRIVDVASGEVTTLPGLAAPTDGGASDLIWDPAGRSVASVGPNGLVIVDLVSGNVRSSTLAAYSEPRWSPDGHRLAYLTGGPSPESRGVAVLERGLSDRVDQALSGATDLAWSPDGRQIAVLTESGTFLVDPDGVVSPKRLSSTAVSTDLSSLAWTEITEP